MNIKNLARATDLNNFINHDKRQIELWEKAIEFGNEGCYCKEKTGSSLIVKIPNAYFRIIQILAIEDLQRKIQNAELEISNLE